MNNNVELPVDDIIKEFLGKYAHHKLKSQMASNIDGLKPIHRRILWCVKKEGGVRRVSVITGATLESYHIAGDSSISTAITTLAQPWCNKQPLLTGIGGIGNYAGDEASAPRYLKARMSDFSADMFFDGVDTSAFATQLSDTGDGLEPKYFVPKLPMALLTGSFGIALGYKSEIAPGHLESVAKAVGLYIRAKKKGASLQDMEREFGDLFIPDFPFPGLIRNVNAVKSAYRRGEFRQSMIFDGRISISPKMIIIESLPPSETPSSVEKLIGKMSVDKKPNFINTNFTEFIDSSSCPTICKYKLTLKRGVNPFDVLPELKKLINFTKRWTPIPMYASENDRFGSFSPLQILDRWYTERRRNILGGLNNKQHRLIRELRKLNALLKIVDHGMEIVKLFNGAPNVDAVIPKLCKRFDLTQFQARYLASLPLSSLTNQDKDDLIAKRTKAKDAVNNLNAEFTTIDERIANDAMTMGKKWSIPRNSEFPIYTGAIRIDGKGYIQFTSVREMEEILSKWRGFHLEVIHYPKGRLNKIYTHGAEVYDEESMICSKEFTADTFQCTATKPTHTIMIKSREAIFSTTGIKMHPDEGFKSVFVSSGFITIDKKGIVKKTTLQDSSIPSRKSHTSTGVMTDIDSVWPLSTNSDEVVVVHCNDKEINRVRIDRIKFGNKLLMMPLGNTEIIGIFKAEDEFTFTVPKKYLKRVGIPHINIQPSDLKDGTLNLDISRKTAGNRKIVMRKSSSVSIIK